MAKAATAPAKKIPTAASILRGTAQVYPAYFAKPSKEGLAKRSAGWPMTPT